MTAAVAIFFVISNVKEAPLAAAVFCGITLSWVSKKAQSGTTVECAVFAHLRNICNKLNIWSFQLMGKIYLFICRCNASLY